LERERERKREREREKERQLMEGEYDGRMKELP
jgi:hypothetical protein